MCVVKEERVETVDRSPVLKCSHTSQEKCHFTYLTIFSPAQVAVDALTQFPQILSAGRKVRRDVREEMPDQLQAGGIKRHCEEVSAAP